jgi:hypothetical protein
MQIAVMEIDNGFIVATAQYGYNIEGGTYYRDFVAVLEGIGEQLLNGWNQMKQDQEQTRKDIQDAVGSAYDPIRQAGYSRAGIGPGTRESVLGQQPAWEQDGGQRYRDRDLPATDAEMAEQYRDQDGDKLADIHNEGVESLKDILPDPRKPGSDYG